MAGAAKVRVSEEKAAKGPRTQGSSSGGTSSSGHPSRSAAGSAAVTARSSGSRAGPSARGYDGNRDPDDAVTTRNPNASRVIVEPKNFDLGMTGWATVRSQDLSSSMPARQAPSKMGQAIKVGLNTFHVEQFPNIPVYQYDVMIGNGTEKRGMISKVWNSKAVQKEMGDGAIFDGNKLAWSGRKVDRDIKVTVDLDQEQGRTPRDKPDQHRVVIRCTNTVGFQTLLAHLQGRASFDNTCLETINFADHLLRQTPSQKYSSIKRNFFQKGEKRFDLGGGVEAFKGIFASLRVVHPGRLSVNLDVANGTFWVSQPLTKAALAVCGCRDVPSLVNELSRGEKGRAGQALKRMRKLHVEAGHRGRGNVDGYVIEKFIYTSAKDFKFNELDAATGKEKPTTVYDYFARKFNIRLQFPGLPLVKMTRGKNTVLPMETLNVKENQRYAFKMDERQTSNMIKFAVTPPPERWSGIEQGLKLLDWNNDPVLKKYGMRISTSKTITEARLLAAPTVKFGTGDAKPGTSGRWDLKGKKFFQANTAPLKCWSVTVISGRRGGKPDKSTIERFIQSFVTGYKNHGGRVENTQPAMSLANGDDVGAWVTNAWNAAGNQSQMRPQMLMFILPDKDSQVYGRIKRSAECRYGVVSQCVQYAHVQKCQPQYISNVCMKFNAKLGGITCRAMGQKTGGPAGIFTGPTMVIGADVSHAAPGAQTPSMAALTISMDKLATRYAALCQTNGFRVEMINSDIILNELKGPVQAWMQNCGGGKAPSTVIYMRDGVSEGQYSQVLQQEVADLKKLFAAASGGAPVKFIVIVGSKRHHIRFFPEKGDRNGNAHPGTLVESGVTNPYENDFFLQSHAAIKGTARPVHYYVLMNEPNMPNDWLHTMLYEHSYQYQRATTPISQHPAIYYAHLASNRAIPHDPKWSGSSDGVPTSESRPRSGSQSGGSQGKSAGRSGSSSGAPPDVEKLLDMPNQGNIKTSMWYI